MILVLASWPCLERHDSVLDHENVLKKFRCGKTYRADCICQQTVLGSAECCVVSSVAWNSGIQPFMFAYPEIWFLFNFVPPKLLVHNVSYTYCIIYI
jgi:hypothetical protein